MIKIKNCDTKSAIKAIEQIVNYMNEKGTCTVEQVTSDFISYSWKKEELMVFLHFLRNLPDSYFIEN